MLGERWVARPTRLLTVFHRAARSYAYSLCARSARIYVGAAPASPAGSVPASSPPGARTSSSGGSEASDRAGRQQKLSFTRWACCCGCCCGSCCGSQAQLQCSWMSSLPARVPGTPHCTSEPTNELPRLAQGRPTYHSMGRYLGTRSLRPHDRTKARHKANSRARLLL